MRRKYALVFLTTFFILNNVSAQKWMELWQSENNFYKIQTAFREYCKEHAEEENSNTVESDNDEGPFPGYIQFKRWEAFVEPRVYPSGDLSLLSSEQKNFEIFLKGNRYKLPPKSDTQNNSIGWTAMGPFGALSGNATNGLPRKAGRINFITLDPAHANTFYVGAPAGGLWKTTDNGSTWSVLNENLSVIGCTDLAIDPTNSNIMYLATGDGYFSQKNPSSIGVLKSLDGGQTWDTTGLVFPASPKVEMRHIIINPNNPQIVMASTSTGVYRSTTGGSGPWTQVVANNTFDLEFKPTSPDTVYAGGLRFRRSTDGGVTFSQISAGIPTSGSLRMEVATTPANPDLVYVVSSNSSAALQGVYRSTDGGTTFTLMASTPNIIGNDCVTLSSASGQGWYDLAFEASPTNQNELVLGALGAWHSIDGGATWALIGCGYSFTANPPYVHTDHHEFEYSSSGVLYDVNDGGVFQYTGTQWNDLTGTMNIAQLYKIGVSDLSPDLWISGHQDNGSNIYSGGVYRASLAADGTDCFIDRTNDQTMYASISSGAFYKSTNGGTSWNPCTTGITAAGAFVTPWKQDPQVPTTLYAGRTQMFKSLNSAGSWSATPGVMSGVSSSEYITEFAIAPSNNQYIYAIHGTTGMFVSTDGATSWNLRNTGISIASGALTSVSVDPSNPSIAYVTQSGFSSGKKVYKTIDAGLTWTNVSYNLPNLPVNCSAFEIGSATGKVYIGMDAGVYYIDNTSITWTLYNSGLPNTPVMDLGISAAAPNKLRAATFGRGVYEIDLSINTGLAIGSGNGKKINVYPNPSHNQVTVDIQVEKPTDLLFEISDVAGKILFTQSYTYSSDKATQLLNMSAFSKGIYFLKVSTKQGLSETVKLIRD